MYAANTAMSEKKTLSNKLGSLKFSVVYYKQTFHNSSVKEQITLVLSGEISQQSFSNLLTSQQENYLFFFLKPQTGVVSGPYLDRQFRESGIWGKSSPSARR